MRLWYEAPYWQLSFADSALGVDTPQQAQIFERFFRTEESRNRVSGGSVLRLAICKNIVDAHGGHIAAEHSDLDGLKIALQLPMLPNRN